MLLVTQTSGFIFPTGLELHGSSGMLLERSIAHDGSKLWITSKRSSVNHRYPIRFLVSLILEYLCPFALDSYEYGDSLMGHTTGWTWGVNYLQVVPS